MLSISDSSMLITDFNLIHRQIDGMAPTFSKKPSIRQEEDGKRLLFECRIQADPRPSVSWSHNGAAVQNSSRHKVSYFYLNILVYGVLKRYYSRQMSKLVLVILHNVVSKANYLC